MKLTRLLFCLFFLILSAAISFASEDTIDLGETGFSCPLAIKSNGESFVTAPMNNFSLNPINLS